MTSAMTTAVAFGSIVFGVWLLLREPEPGEDDKRRDARGRPRVEGAGGFGGGGDGPAWSGGDGGGGDGGEC